MTIPTVVEPGRFRSRRPLSSWPVIVLAMLVTTMYTASPGYTQDEDEAPQPAELTQDELEVEVDRLVAALDARKLAERQEAERALIALGPKILEMLPRENDLPTAEMRQRLKRVISRLEKVESTTSIDATPVTIDSATTLGEALTKITQQSKVGFEGQYDESQSIDISVNKVPFWSAVDEVLDAAGLEVNVYGGAENALTLTSRSDTRPSRSDSAAYAGVFRVEPMNVIARRDLLNPDVNGLDVMIDIAWEPRLTPLGLSFPLKDIQAQLDNGAKLELQSSAESTEAMPTNEVPSTQATLPFGLPAGRPKSIETLTGTIDALLPGKVKKFEFDLSQESFEPRDAGDVTISLDSVTANGSLHVVRVLVKFKKSDRALESHRGWVFDNPAYAITASDASNEDAPKIENLGYEIFRQTGDEVGIAYLYNFDGDPSGFRFRYETPTTIVRNKVTFRLHDIPLP